MSSGEKAKPPATFEERNPFDISRRSGPEVAAEIAKRMSALKQARARTTTPPATTIPEAKSRIADVKSAPIAAPVQPARMPKSAPPAPTATTRAVGSSTLRVPYFASASATRRAMPPAPSLKQGSQRQLDPKPDELVAGLQESAMPIAASVLEQPPLDATNPAMTKEEAVVAEPAAAIEADAAAAPSDPMESPLMAQASAPVEPDDSERRRAEARAIKARWIAAHDLDGLLDTSAAETAPADAAAAHQAGGSEGAETSGQPADDLDSPLPDEKPDDAGGDELLLDEPVEPERAPDVEEPAIAPDLAAPARGPIAVSAASTERLEPTFDAVREASEHDSAVPGRKDPTFDMPVVQQTPDSAHEPGIATEDDAVDKPGAEAAANAVTEQADLAADEGLSIAALDEIAGRKEPTFDKAVQHEAPKIEQPVELQEEAATQSRADEPSATYDSAPEESRAVKSALSIAALDEAAGRKEPTFDAPAQRAAPETEQPVPIEAHAEAAPKAHAEEPAAAIAPEDDRADQLSIAALDEAAGRKEPTFDEPVPPAKPAAVSPAAPRIALRPIETRIEVRRIDTLRADPPLSARRPIFPHIEREEWDMAPMVAAQAHRERRGTSWAIGLGAVLLVAGITAPAAIWQQGRQAQDQVALMDPAPAPQQGQAPAPAATAAAQATLPAAPQPEASAPAPAIMAQEPDAPSAPDQAAPKPEQAAADPKPATTLGAVSDGGDVSKSPVMTPPPPTVNLASKTEGADVMIARPFVPEQGSGPFLRAPTTGAATVPVAGAPVQSAAVGVKPNLMGQLKPKASTTVSAAKPVVSKTKPARTTKPFFQQSPEQMFNTLVDTLGEGKPVNPATKPAAPSNRR
jgi:hypothetical protein